MNDVNDDANELKNDWIWNSNEHTYTKCMYLNAIKLNAIMQ